MMWRLRLPAASRIRGRLAHGSVLLVPVRVQGQDFEFLVDTGAAYTALSPEIVTLLGLIVVPSRTITIVPAYGALVQVPVITIAELRIGGLQVLHVEAMVLQFPQPLKLDGLLGMNVLKQFRMTIEVDTQTLVLRPLGRSFP